MPSLELAAGQVLTAAHTNTYWMRQAIATGLSSARPTGYEGRAVYDTDTDALMVYASPTTGWKPPWNLPWGVIAKAQLTANSATFTTSADLTGMSCTFTAVPGRRYMCWVTLNVFQQVSTDLVSFYITGPAGSGVKQLIASPRPGDFYSTVDGSIIQEGLSGSVTLKVARECLGGGGYAQVAASAQFPAQFVIMDVGPYSAPA
jgi:hypothetical protein